MPVLSAPLKSSSRTASVARSLRFATLAFDTLVVALIFTIFG